jgi:8-oxo-dGTP pyrophosphatase MutT (NUDIX family)
MLEVPAGRRDVEGEEPLSTAQRELAEEIGRGADTWEPIMSYYSSVGFTSEKVELFLATDLHDAEAESEENERIEIVAWPLNRLDDAIEASTDAKTVIGLMWLRERLRR